jgi:hypothetical protein
MNFFKNLYLPLYISFTFCSLYLLYLFSYIVYGIIQDITPPNILKPIEIYYCQNHNQFAIRKLKYIDTNLVFKDCYCNKKDVFIINKSHKDFETLNIKYQICSKILNLKENQIINFISWYNENKNNQFYIMSKSIRQNTFIIASNQTIDLNNLNNENIVNYSYDIIFQYPVKPEEINNGNYIGNRKDYNEYKLEKTNPIDYYALTIRKPFF